MVTGNKRAPVPGAPAHSASAQRWGAGPTSQSLGPQSPGGGELGGCVVAWRGGLGPSPTPGLTPCSQASCMENLGQNM